MGLSTEEEATKLVPFTKEHLNDRNLIIKMLKWEDKTLLGEEGQCVYRNKYNKHLQPHFAVQRQVLRHFGFDPCDESLKNYREIFRTYYNGPEDYDKEVLDSVVYMRENRCVYYTSPIIDNGDILPDCRLFCLDGKTETSIHKILDEGGYQSCVVGAFSTS